MGLVVPDVVVLDVDVAVLDFVVVVEVPFVPTVLDVVSKPEVGTGVEVELVISLPLCVEVDVGRPRSEPEVEVEVRPVVEVWFVPSVEVEVRLVVEVWFAPTVLDVVSKPEVGTREVELVI